MYPDTCRNKFEKKGQNRRKTSFVYNIFLNIHVVLRKSVNTFLGVSLKY